MGQGRHYKCASYYIQRRLFMYLISAGYKQQASGQSFSQLLKKELEHDEETVKMLQSFLEEYKEIDSNSNAALFIQWRFCMIEPNTAPQRISFRFGVMAADDYKKQHSNKPDVFLLTEYRDEIQEILEEVKPSKEKEASSPIIRLRNTS